MRPGLTSSPSATYRLYEDEDSRSLRTAKQEMERACTGSAPMAPGDDPLVATLLRRLQALEVEVETLKKKKPDIDDVNRSMDLLMEQTEQLTEQRISEKLNQGTKHLVAHEYMEQRILQQTKHLVTSEYLEDKLLDVQIQFDERALLLSDEDRLLQKLMGKLAEVATPDYITALEPLLTKLLRIPSAGTKIAAAILNPVHNSTTTDRSSSSTDLSETVETPIAKHLHALAYQASALDRNVDKLQTEVEKLDSDVYSKVRQLRDDMESQIEKMEEKISGLSSRFGGNSSFEQAVSAALQTMGAAFSPSASALEDDEFCLGPGGSGGASLGDNVVLVGGGGGGSSSSSATSRAGTSSIKAQMQSQSQGGPSPLVKGILDRTRSMISTEIEVLQSDVEARYEVLQAKFQLLSEEIWPDQGDASYQFHSPALSSSANAGGGRGGKAKKAMFLKRANNLLGEDEEAAGDGGGNDPNRNSGQLGDDEDVTLQGSVVFKPKNNHEPSTTQVQGKKTNTSTGTVTSSIGTSSYAINPNNLVTKDQFLALTALVEAKVSLSELHAKVCAIVNAKLKSSGAAASTRPVSVPHTPASVVSPPSPAASSSALVKINKHKGSSGGGASTSTSPSPEQEKAGGDQSISESEQGLVAALETLLVKRVDRIYDNLQQELAELFLRETEQSRQKNDELQKSLLMKADLADVMELQDQLRRELQAVLPPGTNLQPLTSALSLAPSSGATSGSSSKNVMKSLTETDQSGVICPIDKADQHHAAALSESRLRRLFHPRIRLGRFVWRGAHSEKLCRGLPLYEEALARVVEDAKLAENADQADVTESRSCFDQQHNDINDHAEVENDSHHLDSESQAQHRLALEQHANINRLISPTPPSDLTRFCVPWEVELLNTDSGLYGWNAQCCEIRVKEGGLFLVSAGMFGGAGADVRILLNGREQLRKRAAAPGRSTVCVRDSGDESAGGDAGMQQERAAGGITTSTATAHEGVLGTILRSAHTATAHDAATGVL
eukprot:g16143.t1